MVNPLYQAMQQPNIMSELQNLKQNPVQFLMQKKFNIPQNIANDPNAIIQHLMNSGQVTQGEYDSAIKKAQQFSQR
jgi:hypothetical protein